MNTILTYLDNMFLNLPNTAEVNRAREELATMMEDKYNELIAFGKKENEAVGIVISEFGNLDELAAVLGMENFMNQKTMVNDKIKMVNHQEAEEYMRITKSSSKWISIGVFICICSPILLFISGGIDSDVRNLTEVQMVCFGLIPLFVLIAIAVAIFIFNGIKLEKFEYLKNKEIQIDNSLNLYLAELEERVRPGFTSRLIIGTMLCIFSVIPLLIVGSITDNNMVHALSICFMLVMIGVAVVLFINGGVPMECIKVLRQEGEFTKQKKENSKIIGIIASFYWPLATAIYLLWSLLTMHWRFTWIVWPIAGIIFGGIAAVCSALEKEN